MPLLALETPVELSPSVAEVVEKGNVTLTCTYKGSDIQADSFWVISNDPNLKFSTIYLTGETCNASGYISTVELYDWNCLGNSTFALTLKNVGRNKHGEKWECIQNHNRSNEIKIFVKVPIHYIRINTTSNETIKRPENSTIHLKCVTSYCRPAPTVSWFFDAGTLDKRDDKIIVPRNQTQDVDTNDEGLVSISSVISFNPNRSVNGWKVYCSGNNILERIASISKATKLNISYPPDGPPVIDGFSNGSVYNAIDEHLGNLSCSVAGGNPLAVLTWYCNKGSVKPVITDSSVTSIVTWIVSRDQNNSCKCTSEHNTTEMTFTEVKINVLYPPSLPVLSIASSPVYNTVNIIANNTLSVNCTSHGKPKPKIKWITPGLSTSVGQLLFIENILETDGGNYNCTAANIMISSQRENVTGSNTTSVVVNILFPPSEPIFRYENASGKAIKSDALEVVENDTFTISCTSSANPEPKLSWSGEIVGAGTLTISSISADLNKTCSAINEMNETIGVNRLGAAKRVLSFRVLHPPRELTIRYLTSQRYERDCFKNSQKLSVIENTSFALSCMAISKPGPSYSWYGPITSKLPILEIDSINRKQKGEYSCNAFNIMQRSFGRSQRGNNTRKMYLDILYPPAVDQLANQTVVEGSPFSISCPVFSGNPGAFTITWRRNGDTKQWSSQTLHISNTLREDDMIYTCIAYNSMRSTCENETRGESNRSFHLNVVYGASIVRFYVNGLVGQPEIIVNENDPLEFSCHTESNPKSSIKIGFEERILISKSNVNTLTYTIIKATCSNEGVYNCFGSNTYNNGEASQKHLTLRVNCFPRPSRNVQVHDKIYTTEFEQAVLSFTASAYPEPDRSGFKWQRQIGLMWNTLANNRQVRITTFKLKSNLTIINVTKSDFGKYRLSIENTVGIYEQTFYLAAKAPPDKPTEFKVIEDELTDTRVTLRWKPGINYGAVQHFILQIYKQETDVKWVSANVTDSNDSIMNYTFTSLLSGTRYTAIIFALTGVGSSDDLSISFQMKSKPNFPTKLEILQNSVKDTSVIVQWRPSSDGGAEQTFILKYSKYLDDDWKNISICETGSQLQTQTITDLSSGSKYKLFLISTNRFGNSERSETLDFRTKDFMRERLQDQTVFIGLLTGLSASSALNITLIVMVSCLFKRLRVRGHMKDPLKETDGTALVSASYGPCSNQSGKSNSGAYEDLDNEMGQDLTKESSGLTKVDNKKDARKVTDGKPVLYEEIVPPICNEKSTGKKTNDGYEVPMSQAVKNAADSVTKTKRRVPMSQAVKKAADSVTKTKRRGAESKGKTLRQLCAKITKKRGVDHEYKNFVGDAQCESAGVGHEYKNFVGDAQCESADKNDVKGHSNLTEYVNLEDFSPSKR